MTEDLDVNAFDEGEQFDPLEQQAEIQSESYDLDGDGKADITSTRIDLDGDGIADYEQVAIDVDADGIPDLVAEQADLDGDGFADVQSVVINPAQDQGPAMQAMFQDLDQEMPVPGTEEINPEPVEATDQSQTEAEPEAEEGTETQADTTDAVPVNPEQEAWDALENEPVNQGEELAFVDGFDEMYADLTVDGQSYEDYYQVHGTPQEDMMLWDQQDEPMSCAVATTNMMFRSVGIEAGEAQLAEIFKSHGIYDPVHGTNPDLIDDVINDIAETHNLPVEATEHNGFKLDDLKEMLDNGQRPLVGVDSYELQGNDDMTVAESNGYPDAGHAIQVTGIESGPEGEFVIINDPGYPGGAGQRIPVDTFMDAAEDCGFKAITVTSKAA